MNWRSFGNVFKLIGHDLENTEFLMEFLDNLLKSSNYTFYSTVNVPDGHTIILCEFEELKSKASQKRHNLVNTEFSANFFESLKTDSKLFQMVKIYPSISWRIVGNVIKLIGHILENTESSADFCTICSIVLTIFPSLQSMFQMAGSIIINVNLKDIGATLNTESFAEHSAELF